MDSNDIPDGSRVEAMTYENPELEIPPRRVTGRLLKRPLPAYTQCFVDGTLVDPATVRPAPDTSPSDSD